MPKAAPVLAALKRDKAERTVVEAVAFTLEGDDDASRADAEIRYLNVEIAAS